MNIQDRKQANVKVFRAKNGVESVLKENKELSKKADKKVKASAKADKGNCIDALANGSQNAAKYSDKAAVYNITTQQSGKNSSRNVPIKKRTVLSSDKHQKER